MTKIETSANVRATTPTNARVSRAWKVRGVSFPMTRRNRPRWRGLPLGECVAHPSDGQDERGHGRIVLDFVAEMADMDVDRLLVLVEGLVVAQQLEQLRARVDP